MNTKTPKRPPSTPPTTARDREMGRDAPQSGDLGQGKITWAPPPGQPGISNRPDDDPDATKKDDPDASKK